MQKPIPIDQIEKNIFLIRGQKTMIDVHLAKLYKVETKALNRAVKRNLERFPSHFMFQLTSEEYEALRYQIGTLKKGRGHHKKYLPYAFTEQGVAMLSSVLRSKRAIQVNIVIMDIFVKLRQMMISHRDLARKISQLERKYDFQFKEVFEALRALTAQDLNSKKKIGFKI